MKLTWCGHACFLLESSGGSIVFDPYSPGSVPGVTLPELRADKVLCSHSHGDHCYPQAVTLSGREPALNIRQIKSFHDDVGGAKRGENLITVVEAEGQRVVHLGDLGHMLSDEQVTEIGPVDVLLIPVGGFFTIDAAAAWRLAEKIAPRILIPMHYRGAGFGFEVIAPVDGFLALAGNVQRLDTNVIDPAQWEGPVTAVLQCPVDEGRFK